jgi:hypothetical protein
MKKILSILSSISLVASSASTLTSCSVSVQSGFFKIKTYDFKKYGFPLFENLKKFWQDSTGTNLIPDGATGNNVYRFESVEIEKNGDFKIMVSHLNQNSLIDGTFIYTVPSNIWDRFGKRLNEVFALVNQNIDQTKSFSEIYLAKTEVTKIFKQHFDDVFGKGALDYFSSFGNKSSLIIEGPNNDLGIVDENGIPISSEYFNENSKDTKGNIKGIYINWLNYSFKINNVLISSVFYEKEWRKLNLEKIDSKKVDQYFSEKSFEVSEGDNWNDSTNNLNRALGNMMQKYLGFFLWGNNKGDIFFKNEKSSNSSFVKLDSLDAIRSLNLSMNEETLIAVKVSSSKVGQYQDLNFHIKLKLTF